MDEKEKQKFIYLLEQYTPKHRKKLMQKMQMSFKNKVRAITRKFVKEHNIEINKCSNCGNDYYIEFHHKDYEHPYIVAPLCKTCHGLQHSNNPPQIKFIDLEKLVK